MMLCPSKISPQELIILICAELKKLGADDAFKNTVISRVKRRFEQKCQNAQAFRSFSERITNAALRPDHITPETNPWVNAAEDFRCRYSSYRKSCTYDRLLVHS